jgi:hypothetical protein
MPSETAREPQNQGFRGAVRRRATSPPVSRLLARALRRSWGDENVTRGLAWCFRGLALGIGGLHVWVAATQESMSEDGISYLDMGDAYLRGDWSMAINTVWSPLYAWIQGLARMALRPSMAWEFSLVHSVNFAIYAFTLIAFEYFWRQVAANRITGPAHYAKIEQISFPVWVWTALGYALFTWTSLSLIKIWAVTPDMLTAGLVFLASGFLLNIGKRDASWRTFFLFGLVLGIAYLAKAVMFPLAFVFLAAGFLVAGKLCQAWPRMLVALGAFLLIAAPFITVISLSKGRLTFGDAGKLTYLRYANEVPYPHWTADLVSGVGSPQHPARQIFENPDVFEFATPVGGTYPLSYDPSYWYEGVSPHLDLPRQTALLMANSQFYFDLFVRQQGAMSAIVLLLLLASVRPFPGRQRWLGSELAVLIVACGAFGLYALVYVEGRYIAPFVILFWAGLLSYICLPNSISSQRLLRAAGSVLLLFILVNVISFNLEGLTAIREKRAPIGQTADVADAPRYRPLQMAETLLKMGVRQGDEIAFIGYSFGAFFARLARLRIIAEIPDGEAKRFWHAPELTRSAAIEAIANTGARAIIAEWVSPGVSLEGWERVGQSRHFIYRLH